LLQNLEKVAKEKGVELILPTDVIIANKFAADADAKVRSLTDWRHPQGANAAVPFPQCLFCCWRFTPSLRPCPPLMPLSQRPRWRLTR
jgi:hypothetical protein